MSLPQLLDELDRCRVRLWMEDGLLRFEAPAGAMTADLKARIAASKPALMARLGAAPPPAARTDDARADDPFAPFPQTPIQEAYRVGRSAALALGGFAATSYIEFERGQVDFARAESCLNAVIARHGMLRTVLLADGTQKVLETVPPCRIPVMDLRGLPPEEAERRRAELRETIAHRVRDPAAWPLFELHFTVSDTAVRLHSCVDLIALDAWSSQLFFQEWFTLLETGALPPPPAITFREALAAARGGEATRDRARAHWARRLPQLPPAPRLPAPRRGADTTPGRFHRFLGRLEAPRWSAFQAHCRARQVTPTVALATLFANVLSHFSRNEDVTLNVTLFNRPPVHPDIRRVLGEFTNTTLIGFDGMERTFAAQAAATREELFTAIEHGAMSGVELLRELARLRQDFSGAPMPVVFTSLLIGADGGGCADLGWRQVCGTSQTPQVALDHQLYEEQGALCFNWDVAVAALDLDAAGAAFTRYEELLARLADEAAAWDAPLPRDLPAASTALRARLHPIGPFPTPRGADLASPFWTGLHAAAARDAVIWSGGRLTHEELARRAAALGARLREAGVRPGDRVAIRLPKGPLQMVTVLGTLHAGGVYVPLASDQPPARRAAIRRQVEPRVEIIGRGDPAETEGPVLALDLDDAPAGGPLPALAAGRVVSGHADPAYVIFTSGSTGTPKGATLSHGAVLNTLEDMAARFGMSEADRVLALSALNFDLSVYDIFAPLGAGGALVLPDAGTERNPAHWHALAVRHGVSVWNSVPMLLKMLLAWAEGAGTALPQSLRLALVSGDWVPLDLSPQLRRLSPATRLVALGGATEAAIWSNWQEVEAIPEHWTSVPYGLPLAHQYYRVRDRYGVDRPDLVPGELHIGGLGLADGYWGDAAATAAAFIRCPARGERLYRTGDIGRFWPDGTLEFLGRDDDRVKVGGHRIELGEIVHALERLPAVARAAALVEDAGGGRQIVAHVAAEAGAEAPSEAALLAHCRTLLPAYMVPARIGVHGALPLSANGKIDMRALAALPRPVPPRTRLRRAGGPVRAIMEEVVGIRPMPADAAFFSLGATSLKLVEAHARLTRELGIELEVTDLFVHASLEMLEAHIATLAPPARPEPHQDAPRPARVPEREVTP